MKKLITGIMLVLSLNALAEDNKGIVFQPNGDGSFTLLKF